MRTEPPWQPCTFLRRYKRFFADVRLPDGATATVHCPNSGSMRGVATPERPAWISDSGSPTRKLRCTLEAIEVTDGVRALVNTQRPNGLAAEAVAAGWIPALAGHPTVEREVAYGSRGSRVDLRLRGGGRVDCYVEVKNVTLGGPGGVARFPDAVTERGLKHLHELMDVAAGGARAVLLFCVGREDAHAVAPADDIDPAYGLALRAAATAGVELLAFGVRFLPGELRLDRPLEVHLPPLT